VAQKTGYQHRDQHIVDYQVFSLLPRLEVRGPKPPLDPGSFFTCLGAAQTFGRFCERPFPTIISEELELPVLNLGAAGAGPLFYVRRPRLLEYVNRARFAIVQVMSARSEDNSVFETLGTGLMTRRSDGVQLISDAAYQELLDTRDEEFVRRVVAETRANWLRRFRTLFAKIQVPTILFWFSERPPDYSEDYSDVEKLFGYFPQLVNSEMMAELEPLADAYVECVTSRGIPQPLFDRFTGEPTTMVDIPPGLGGRVHTHNWYYPTPEMQEDAAAALLESARSMLERTAVEHHARRS
jgi:Domain of unknown function (DUF6473)